MTETAGFHATLSPVDLPGDGAGEGAPLRWTAQIVALSCAVLCVLNATAIRGWASELAPGPLTEPAIAAADTWHELASRSGLAAPVETMHGWWEDARAARFRGASEASGP